MQVKELFAGNVTRDIPPVVYFHEQSPASVASEVSEYIITGGYPEGHPSQRRVPKGIHEEYVRLLETIVKELEKPGGPELPNSWISGFYGSGKSSFAKLLGLALDGMPLPDGRSVADAWLARNTSPRAAEMKTAWGKLRARVEPMAVVFDVGTVARDGEHLHSAALRKVQERLGYCPTNSIVADYELTLERDGLWRRFEEVAAETLEVPWSAARKEHRAADRFSLVMHRMFGDEYPEPTSWFDSRAGGRTRTESPEEVVVAIRDMLGFRKPAATLFLIVDEVSQYVISSQDRYDRLRAFATALGSGLKGKAWLLALGQQQLDDQADLPFATWVRDRFPPQLRVHLAATNIRDVVHKRLLQKTPAATRQLAELFERHRADLKLYAFGCEAITSEEFVEIYPMLPGQIELILQITTAGGSTCPLLTLDEVVERDPASLKRSVGRARLVVVHSREIDVAGEAGVSLDEFDKAIRKIKAAWQLLREAGVKRFVVTSDHGFLLPMGPLATLQPHGRRIDPKPRYALAPVVAATTGEVAVSLADLGYEGAVGCVVFPETTALFDTGGRPPLFVHGGNSLQERLVPVVTAVHRSKVGASTIEYTVTAQPRTGVAGMHCIEATLVIASQTAMTFSAADTVELALRVPEDESVRVELCDVRNASRDGSVIRATVGQPFEVFFRLLGATDTRVLVELHHPGLDARVIPGHAEARFAVTPVSSVASEPRPASRGEAWLEAIEDTGFRQVFAHIAAHGAIAETEIAAMLGSPRAARRFSVQFDALAERAPFRVRIENLAGVKRYAREGGER